MKSLQEWLSQQGAGPRLKALRVQADLSGKALADQLSWAQSKVSRIENGNQTPSADDVRAWAQATGATDEVTAELLGVREETRIVSTTFSERMHEGQDPVQRDYAKLQQQSALIRYFQTAWVPGVLQVPEYSRRVFTEMEALHHSIDDIDDAVAQRQERTRGLYDSARRWEFLLAEPVLRWVLPAPAVMRAQLDRLQSVIGLDNARLGIIPMGRQIPWTPQNAVEIYVGEETVVSVETFIGEAGYRGEAADFYMRMLDRLWEEAVEGDEARELIMRATRALREP